MEPKTTLTLTAEITPGGRVTGSGTAVLVNTKSGPDHQAGILTLQMRTVRKINDHTFDVVFEGTAEEIARSASAIL